MKPPAIPEPWRRLRELTPARVALGRVGDSLPTAALLEFGLAHAQARDAVHVAFDVEHVMRQLSHVGLDGLAVASAAPDRATYLRRPDLGRRLRPSDRERLCEAHAAHAADGGDALAIVLADGLSARAVERHAVPVVTALLARLTGRTVLRPIVASQSRVALGDEIAETLGAAQVLVLIGERPGLTSHDSLGAYLTHRPRVGTTDAERNCVSNIRPAGLAYDAAAARLAHLLALAQRLGVSGVALDVDAPPALAR